MQVLIFLLTLLLIPAVMVAQDLSLKLDVESNETILGLPIRGTLSINGPGKFNLPGKFSADCDRFGGFIVKDQSGNRVEFSSGMPCSSKSFSPFDSESKTEYNQGATTEVQIFLPQGKYTLQGIYESKGPFLDRYSESDQRPVKDIWTGQLQSNIVTVEVKFPSGDDAHALLNLGPSSQNPRALDYGMFVESHKLELIKNYPDSTYSAYVILQRLGAPEEVDPRKLKQVIDEGYFPRGNSVPDPYSPDGWREISDGRSMAEWQIEKAKHILNNHPAFPYSDRLNLIIGVNNLSLGKREEAMSWLNKVARKEETKSGKWAKMFLEVMQQ